jgi:hypothetical protein
VTLGVCLHHAHDPSDARLPRRYRRITATCVR